MRSEGPLNLDFSIVPFMDIKLLFSPKNLKSEKSIKREFRFIFWKGPFLVEQPTVNNKSIWKKSLYSVSWLNQNENSHEL